MLDIKIIREESATVRQGLATRGLDGACLDAVLEQDGRRRTLLTEVETLKSRRNTVSKEIGQRKRQGEDTAEQQTAMREIGGRIRELDADVREVDGALQAKLLMLPNLPHASVPVGPDESGNRVIRTWGEPKAFDFEPATHTDLGATLGILDLGRAAKMAGAGFPLFMGAGARLQRALIAFMLDMHVNEHGYTEAWPPALCNAAAMTGTGQLPKMADDMYRLPADDLYLIPTAEVPVTNIFRDEIIESPLPIYLTAFTSCFRREAGAAGKDTHGLIRMHQFDKVEMVKFVEPASAQDELESLLANAEDVIQRLGLTYRVLELCTGDISFAADKCYDIELWAPGRQAWLEVSSCSHFGDFQARRAGIRYRDENGKVCFVHTLNGSGVALARLVVALLENGQQADGSVVLPEPLVPYMNGMQSIGPGAGAGGPCPVRA